MLKRELNKHIAAANRAGDAVKFKKRESHYEPGSMYGNSKIHKNLENPPMRPIVSQIGTITYETSKQLKALIVPYMPRRINVESTHEFLQLLRACDVPSTIASLDVENLFTNFPVLQTIKIILNNVYSHTSMPPPKIPRETLRAFLEKCTTKIHSATLIETD